MMLASGLLAASSFAADLTGHWVASQPGPNGQARQTSIWIKANGDKFTGYLWNERQGNQPIVDGKVDGDRIAFVVVQDNYGEERRQEYTGSITADGLALRMPAFGCRGGRGGQSELIAKRVSSGIHLRCPRRSL